MRAYGYKLPGYFVEYGPVYAKDETQARALVRQRLGVKRLPWGLILWDLASRPLTHWRVDRAS